MQKTKPYFILITALLAGIVILQIIHIRNINRQSTLILTENWEFREAGKDQWYPAEVPGAVHTDLLSNGLIEDPFYGGNEQSLQWIGYSNWEYRNILHIGSDIFNKKHIELVFRGLDTYAEVSLNGETILTADNMFREWRTGCREYIKEGDNELRILFRSPINEILPVMEKIGYRLPASNDQGEKTSPYTRKAPYHFGWDWGPRYVTSGIWQDVMLESYDEAGIRNIYVKQERLSSSRADLTAEIEIHSLVNTSAKLMIETEDDAGSVTEIGNIELKEGVHEYKVTFSINDPVFWWPNGLGDQYLYSVKTSLVIDDVKVDEASKKIGLRTVELQQEVDEKGKSFKFIVNGVPVFAKGGNWIPADNFVTRITDDKYRWLLQSCRDANMNMLRVWGGGIYENDIFYELCDEMGIMVWQDFMFACSMYPGDEEFLDNVRKEAEYQVKRLRGHPSLALWCGNNEIETAWFHWGWKQSVPETVWDDYKKIFHGILLRVCLEYDSDRSYWPSSPSSNLEEDANSQNMGDVHYWDVWHGEKPFDYYETQFPRFNSEFGFQSFPNIKTVNYYTNKEDHDIESPVMLAHQKHPRGNQLIRKYMLREYPEPKDFESFLYVSQVLQAEGIKIGAEHLRRLMPECMGSLYWQVNDCWPVASWSGIDFFGRWKAMHYYSKKFYDNILVSPDEKNGKISVYIVSDDTEASSADLRIRLMDFSGRVIREYNRRVNVEPLTSKIYHENEVDEWLADTRKEEAFLYIELISEDGEVLSSNFHYFLPMKELDLPFPDIDYKTEETGNGVKITLSVNKLARNVYFRNDHYDGFFSDNYFDLTPGRTMEIEFRTEKNIDIDIFNRNLSVISIVNAFR
ncbi:glycoside hydrolase family 2 protein [candidate division KSB1 bacterium]